MPSQLQALACRSRHGEPSLLPILRRDGNSSYRSNYRRFSSYCGLETGSMSMLPSRTRSHCIASAPNAARKRSSYLAVLLLVALRRPRLEFAEGRERAAGSRWQDVWLVHGPHRRLPLKFQLLQTFLGWPSLFRPAPARVRYRY